MSSSVAVIDIGSNTTRLLVRERHSKKGDLAREMKITRLGQGLDSTGELSEESMALTAQVVADFISKAKSLGANEDSIFIYATAAARRAKNGNSFIHSLSHLHGVRANIIEGEAEGEFAFTGVVSGFDDIQKPITVFDVGGASTEIALSEITDNRKCSKVRSIPVGSVVMTNRYLKSDPPAPEELTNVVSEVREYLNDIKYELSQISLARTWIGVASTVTTIAAVELGLAEFDASKIHQLVLTREKVEEVFRTLATENIEDRKHNPGLDPDRAEVIVGGIAIVVAIMRHFDLKEITVSCTDLLDGIWLDACQR